MVAERGSEMKSTATEIQPIACTLIEGDFRDRLAWIAELTRDALRDYERADLTLKLRYAREAVQRVQEMVHLCKTPRARAVLDEAPGSVRRVQEKR